AATPSTRTRKRSSRNSQSARRRISKRIACHRDPVRGKLKASRLPSPPPSSPMKSALPIIGLLILPAVAAAQPKRPIDFETDVRPIFAKACYSCHGPQKQKSDFRLDQKAAALEGGDNGVAIVPGKAGESALVERIASKNARERMPPKDNAPLTAAEVATIRA